MEIISVAARYTSVQLNLSNVNAAIARLNIINVNKVTGPNQTVEENNDTNSPRACV